MHQVVHRSSLPRSGVHWRAVVKAALGIVIFGISACADRPDAHTAAQASSSPWAEGVHFVRLEAVGTETADRSGELIEVFSYACPHCYMFEPALVLWNHYMAAELNLKLVRVPMTTDAEAYGYSHLFYTLNALGRDDLHCIVYDAIHRGRASLISKRDDAETLKLQAEFVEKYGIPRKRFAEVYTSARIQQEVATAALYTRRFLVDRTPTLVINGQFKTDAIRAGGDSNLFAIIKALATDSGVNMEAHGG